MNIMHVTGNFSFYFSRATSSIFLFQYDARNYPNCLTVLSLKNCVKEIHHGTTVYVKCFMCNYLYSYKLFINADITSHCMLANKLMIIVSAM
jgi:hypothetical protein